MWFLFGEVSSSSGCLGWAELFYCGTPCAFHIIILHICLFHVSLTQFICKTTTCSQKVPITLETEHDPFNFKMTMQSILLHIIIIKINEYTCNYVSDLNVASGKVML